LDPCGLPFCGTDSTYSQPPTTGSLPKPHQEKRLDSRRTHWTQDQRRHSVQYCLRRGAILLLMLLCCF